ncbi:hypothetical protein RFI_37780, partial [Reticulomyxa filosa]
LEKHLFSSSLQHQRLSQEKKMEKYVSLAIKSKEEDIQIIIHYWIRILNIKLGWIKDFDKIIINYVSSLFFFFKITIKYSNII